MPSSVELPAGSPGVRLQGKCCRHLVLEQTWANYDLRIK